MQNIVTKCPKRGLETSIYLVLRNNFIFGRERKKFHRQNFCKKIEVWNFFLFIVPKEPSIGFLWNNVYGFVQSSKFESRWCGWFLRTTPWEGGVFWNLLWYVAISSLYQEKRNLSAATGSNHASSLLHLFKYYHQEGGQNSKVSTLSPSSEQLLYFRGRGWWRGQLRLKISGPKTSGWIGKCVSIKKNRGQSKTERDEVLQPREAQWCWFELAKDKQQRSQEACDLLPLSLYTHLPPRRGLGVRTMELVLQSVLKVVFQQVHYRDRNFAVIKKEGSIMHTWEGSQKPSTLGIKQF